MEALKKKYGLFTAICMVVGIVIGSGVFFKSQNALEKAGGDALTSIIAWVIGGIIMVVIASTFAVMATKYERVGGLVDYAEVTCGKRYAYFVGWFLTMIYYPTMTSVLAWASARYTLAVVGFAHAPTALLQGGAKSAIDSPECIAIATFYLILSYFINTVAPRIAGKVQVSTTVIKLIPLIFVALIGVAVGVFSGNLGANLSDSSFSLGSKGHLFSALCCTAFAYEGWIIATAINAEIKDSKKNLPIALFFGTLVIVAIYVLFNVGVLGLADSESIMQNGTTVAFGFFGKTAATVIDVLVIVSCFGTLNGLMLACTRGIYSLAARGEGVRPDLFIQVDKMSNMPHNSAALALLTCVVWFVYFIGGQFFGWFGNYAFDSSELPIITIYPLYVPILIRFMMRERGLHPFKRFVLPSLSIVGSGVMVVASIYSHKMDNVWYLIIFAALMAAGAVVLLLNERRERSRKETVEADE
ncbi:MAG: APC family permease [Clostridia bacterium]|nr:APC family permease [Clostridia bacterium]